MPGSRSLRAQDGNEALRLLEGTDCAVLVVDWQMPSMDGIELTERLRANGKDEIYIIMLTARDSGFDYDRGYLAGVDDYLTKKLPDTELLARIHTGFNMVALRHELKRARARIAQLEAGQR
jgi:DNA-binding response OmpR family regulator